MSKFFKMAAIFGKKKLEQTAQAVNDGLASWDPETASEVEIEMMIGKFEDITTKVAKSKVEYMKEKKEADVIETEFENMMLTAERIQIALDSDPDNADYNEALIEIIDTLEELKPELEREQEEAKDAEEIYRELEQIAESYSSKLKVAKETLVKAKRNMQKAQLREERAKDKEDRVKELAGLKSNTDDLGSALSAFERNADKANTTAEASEMRSKLLKPTKSAKSSVIEQFSKEVAGNSKPTNVADRLAALK